MSDYRIISADSHMVEPPHSREYIGGEAFKRISPAQRQAIVAGNAARLYHIELS